jgi:glycosyltransferase involved in cell wall biosynthesis
MKIVFLDAIVEPQLPGKSGLSDINWRLASEVRKLGVETIILGIYDKNIKPPYPEVNQLPINNYLTPSRTNIATVLFSRFILAWHARRFVDSETVFHISDALTAGMVSLLGFGKYSIWQGHTNWIYHSRFSNPWDRSTFYLLKAFTTISSRSIHFVVALGPSLINWWVRAGFTSKKVVVIPNGIDPSHGIIDQKHKLEINQKWLQSKYRILFVGRLAADKGGFFELFECIQRLNDIEMGTALLIIGDGPLKIRLENYVNSNTDLNPVYFAGHQNCEFLNAAYANTDLFILPSVNEMMPRVMLEAWSAKAAFMATSVGAICDYMTDGFNGYLLENTQQPYFTDRVREVLQDVPGRKKVIENAYEFVQTFNWENVAKQYIRLYEMVVNSTS